MLIKWIKKKWINRLHPFNRLNTYWKLIYTLHAVNPRVHCQYVSGFHNPTPIALAAVVTTRHPWHSQWTIPFTMLLAAAGGRRRPTDTQGQNQGQWGQLAPYGNGTKTKTIILDICTQFGPNPPGSLCVGIRQTDRRCDGVTDRHHLLYKTSRIPVDDGLIVARYGSSTPHPHRTLTAPMALMLCR